MGIYFNPGNEGFENTVRNDIYVDKTGLLNFTNDHINKEKNCIAVSHARRFGKSQAARMLRAYYSRGCDSRELFSGLEISKAENFEKHLNKYNTIHLDISSFADYYKKNLVDKIIEMIYREMKEEYPDIMDINNPFSSILSDVYNRSGKIKFVIIIDEWDCVIRDSSDDPELVHDYLKFLHSLFKSEEAKDFLGIGYITGILPIKKIKNESAMNNFIEYTMIDSDVITEYFGFTQGEVDALCEKYGTNPDSVKAWYNGYLIDGRHMYNPDSVCEAVSKNKIRSYWKNTSSFEGINTYITLNFDGLKEAVISMLKGEKVRVNVSRFKNDFSIIESKDDALTALIHLGYLAYDYERGQAFIPNYEVKTAFQDALETGNWKEIAETLSTCEELLWATIDKDSERVTELIELAHETYTSVLKYNDENALSCAVTMAYFTAPAYYNVIRELPSGKGFADIVMIPRSDSGNKPAMVIELKWDQSADTAIRQIREKRYAGSLTGYSGEILLVGISYDKDSKKHECVIESYTQ